MLARRAKCQLVLAAAQSKSDGDSSSSSAEVPDSGEDRPASSIGLVNLYQSNEKAQTQVVVVLDKAEDGDYLVTFTYAPENMELYNRILQHRVSKLPERRPYEEPRPKVEAPATTNTIGKELCPDRRVLGGIRVEKGMGTLILTDNRFDMFDRVWTPIDGVFSIFPGSEKLGDAKYPDASTELASGRIELDLHHFQSRRDEAALQEAMRPRSMQELVKGTKTTMPLSKAMPLLMAGENRAAFRTLGRFSFAMFLAPLIVFLIVRILAAENPYKDLMSGGAAILAVNVVIGLYALVAYKENVAEQKEVEAEEAAAAARQKALDDAGKPAGSKKDSSANESGT